MSEPGRGWKSRKHHQSNCIQKTILYASRDHQNPRWRSAEYSLCRSEVRWLNRLVFKSEASLSNQIKQNQESENRPFKRRMRGWGSGVLGAGQIKHRNVLHPASFNTRKIKELETPGSQLQTFQLQTSLLRGPLSGDCTKCLPVPDHLFVCFFFFLFFFPCVCVGFLWVFVVVVVVLLSL